ncbi:hypothetical protein BRD56_10165 [Thermoplasmatales archaeon SW_10_69_26]|nr:MAG: hypothetical protein BRD56_10165 [Thermoplasmatales archaeon SW_10_69_26]
MLETPVLALTMGTWTMLGLLGVFALVGLVALTSKGHDPAASHGERRRYVFGLGKYPRLHALPELRDLPATVEPLGPEGLRKLGKKADATTGLTTTKYRIPEGRRPWQLSADIPDTVEAIEIEREGGRLWFTADGHLTAEPPLTEDELDTVGDLLYDVEDRPDLRADRRTWAHSVESPEKINAKRV